MPAFGGRYKGTRFRSLLELSFMLGAERDGLVLGKTLLYEVVRVPYGKGRTYIIDFYLPEEKLLVEVKPRVRTGSKTAKRKFAAAQDHARKNGLSFVVVTEDEIPEILTLEQAGKLDGIEWGVRAQRRQRQMQRRKRG